MSTGASRSATSPAAPAGAATYSPRLTRVRFRDRERGILGYLIRERRGVLAVAVVVPLVTLIALGLDWSRLARWETWSIVISVSTLVVGIAIFRGEAVENWESRLPRRLTVSLLHQGTVRMVCRLAPLAHEGEIRTWGQQLAWQVYGNVQFSPYIELGRDGVVVDPDGKVEQGKPFVHFWVRFRLLKLPDPKDEVLEKLGTEPGDRCIVVSEGPDGAATYHYEPRNEPDGCDPPRDAGAREFVP
jgi:hypothetical protein